MNSGRQIVPGIFVSPEGQASVDSSLSDVLFDLALQLEESTKLPVDVEHVLAAVVLASCSGQIDSSKALTSNDESMLQILAVHVKTVFKDFGGNVGADD